MGIVLNRPTDLQLNDILEQLDIQPSARQSGTQTVYLGGPVQSERGFVLHSNDREWDSTLHITPRISITTSRDILESIAEEKGPSKTFVALGYAGWAGGQLEDELIANAWLNGPADESIIFHLQPEKRWEAAAELLGVDLNLLSGEVGHA